MKIEKLEQYDLNIYFMYLILMRIDLNIYTIYCLFAQDAATLNLDTCIYLYKVSVTYNVR